MTAPSLLDELEDVVRLAEKATPGEWTATVGHDVKQQHGVTVMKAWAGRGPQQEHNAAYVVALVNWFRAHHAELADMAKRLEAAERDSKRLDFMEREHCTVRVEATCDDDVFYEVVDYYMAEPQERVIGSGATPRDALDAAIDATQEGEG